jgi:membrane protein DedA with SNARE-associated domain
MGSLRFLALEFLSALIWTSVFATGGYLFGAAMQVFVRDMRRYDTWILLAVVVVLIGAAYLRRRFPKRAAASVPADGVSTDAQVR